MQQNSSSNPKRLSKLHIFCSWKTPTQISDSVMKRIIKLIGILLGILNVVRAIPITEIPTLKVKLSGGPPEPMGIIEVGIPFPLNCSLSKNSYDSKVWTPVISFLLNDALLGKLQKRTEYQSMNWISAEPMTRGVNVYFNTDTTSKNKTHYSYSVWIQPVGTKSAAQGQYTCAVTLEDDFGYTRARFYSNNLYFD